MYIHIFISICAEWNSMNFVQIRSDRFFNVYSQNSLSFVSITFTSIYRLRFFIKFKLELGIFWSLKWKNYIFTHILNKGTYIKAYVSSLLKWTHFGISIFVANYYIDIYYYSFSSAKKPWSLPNALS